MSKQVQLRRGTTAEHAVFTGALAEVTVDTDKRTLVVHDATTPGGVPLATFEQVERMSGTSLSHTQTESVKSLPTGTLDGVVDNFETRGLSLVNSVVNGDFSDGVAEWGMYQCTASVSGGIATITAETDTPAFYDYLNISTGEKWFVYVKARALSGAGQLIFQFDTLYPKVISAPVLNTWYEMYAVVTAVGTSQVFELQYRNGTVVAGNQSVSLFVKGFTNVF